MGVLTSSLIVSLINRATAPARAIVGSLGSLQAAARRNAAQMGAMRGRLLDAAGAGYVLAKAISSPIQSAIEFQSAMADVRKVVDFPTPQAFARMSKDILQMSTRIPIAATGLAEIVAAAGQAGMKGSELTAFAEMAAKVGIAFDITAGKAGDSLAKMKTALGLTVAETGVLADGINHLSNNMASTAPDILDYMSRVGSVGKQYGFTAEQTAAIGSAMIAAGAEANVAATSFRNVGKALTKGAAATKAQRKAYKQLGLNATKVAKAMQKDAVGTLKQVLERVKALPRHMQAATLSQLFGDEARAFAPLIENMALLEQSLDLVADRANFLGSTQKEYEQRAATTGHAIQLFKNRLNALAVTVGSILLPALNSVMDVLGPMVTRLANLADKYPGVTKGVVGLVGGLVGLKIATIAARWAFLFLKGGVIDVGIAVAKAAGMVAVAAKRMRAAIVGATMLSAIGGGGLIASASAAAAKVGTIATGLGAAVAGITAPIWGTIAVVVAGIALIAAAITRYWEPISNFVSGFAGEIGSVLTDLMSGFNRFHADVSAEVGKWGEQKLIDFGEWLGIEPETMRAALEVAKTTIAENLRSIVETVKSIGSGIGNWLSDMFSVKDYSDQEEAAFRESGARLARALIDGLKSVASEIAAWASTLGGKIAEAVRSGISDLYEAGRKLLLSFWNGMKSIASEIIAWAQGVVKDIKRPFESVGKAISKVKNFFTGSPVDGAKAAGGPVAGGKTYLVGEQGPELFTPRGSGDIIPNHKLGQGDPSGVAPAGAQISFGDIHITGVESAEDIIDELKAQIADVWSGGHFDGEHA